MLSITQDFKEKQGLSGDKWYEAHVVENDDRKHPDKMMLGRIQARVDVLFDGIADKDLPWAIPTYEHPDGASDITGRFSVPKKKTKVFLKFQQANPAFPMYRGFHIDVTTQMEESKYNYPNRSVFRFQNKAMLIVDTEDNTAYLRNPGNLKLFVDGNVEIEVNGDIDEQIHGNVRRRIKGTLDEIVHGDVTREYMDDYNFTIRGTFTRLVIQIFHDIVLGWRDIWTGAAKTETTIGASSEFSTGTRTIQSTSGTSVNIEGSPNVYVNSNKSLSLPTIPSFPSTPEEPKFHKWPGVPGSAKGTNTRKRTKAKASQAQSSQSSSGSEGSPNKTTAGKPCVDADYKKDSLPIMVNLQVETSEEEDDDQQDPAKGRTNYGNMLRSVWDKNRVWDPMAIAEQEVDTAVDTPEVPDTP